MPRQVRIEFAGATYHVMCRGDRREAICEDDTDRECFVGTLAQARKRAGWLIHAYVLMGNHYHLLVETPEPNLVRGMTWFQTTYTVRYNARHRTSGHLYGGRYKAVLVEAPDGGSAGDVNYFSTLVDYIHLNPIRAGLIEVADDRPPAVESYRWSSLPEYRKKRSARPEFLETGRGFGSFGLKDGPAGRRQFVERVVLRAQRGKLEECGLAEIEGQGLQSTLRRGWCYGSPTFKEQMLAVAEDLLSRRSPKRDRSKNYRGADSSDYGIKRAEAIIDSGLAAFDLDQEKLGEMKKSADEKSLIAAIVRKETTVKASWVAEKLQMGSVANVTRASKAIAHRLAGDRRLQRIQKKILANMSS
jgi:REP element-mobilizing transposase RayT